MDKILVVFTMKGCPFCDMLKEKLNEENLMYFDRDIEKYKDEYDLFVKATGSEFVPSFMIIESKEEDTKSYLFTPEKDFNQIDEGLQIIKNHFL
jgi:glutaredoxin